MLADGRCSLFGVVCCLAVCGSLVGACRMLSVGGWLMCVVRCSLRSIRSLVCVG